MFTNSDRGSSPTIREGLLNYSFPREPSLMVGLLPRAGGNLAKTPLIRENIMQKWEYKVLHDIIASEALLNNLGIEGWELIAWENGNYYFKRPKN